MQIATKRIEAFSDGVLSIILTIMVFDIKFPRMAEGFNDTTAIQELIKLAPRLGAYAISFLIIGIMWVNHHHLFTLVQRGDEKLLWYNLHLLFWLSLIPFPTSMLGGNPFLEESAVCYGIVLTMTAFAFLLLRRYVTRKRLMYDKDTRKFTKQIDRLNRLSMRKSYISVSSYMLSIPLAYVSVYLSFICFIIPAVVFFIPDGIDDEELEEEIMEKSR